MKKFGTAVILAGGKSSRMGFDKQLLKLNKRKLMDILVNKLKKEFEEIIIVTNRPEYYIGLSHKIVEDEIVGGGPLSGIHKGLKEASSEMVYFIACDMPNINNGYIKYMKYMIKDIEADACITRFGEWIEPFNSFYNKSLIKPIENHLSVNKRSINTLLEKKKCYYVAEEDARKFSPNWNMFLNLNTKTDLEEYLRIKNN